MLAKVGLRAVAPASVAVVFDSVMTTSDTLNVPEVNAEVEPPGYGRKLMPVMDCGPPGAVKSEAG